jgi:exonuclease III
LLMQNSNGLSKNKFFEIISEFHDDQYRKIICLQHINLDKKTLTSFKNKYGLRLATNLKKNAGVIIMFPKRLGKITKIIDKDQNGRILGITITTKEGYEINIINIYAPPDQNLENNKTFYINLLKTYKKFTKTPIIVGDFNAVYSEELDIQSSNPINRPADKYYRRFMNQLNLEDTYRTQHPDSKEYTFEKKIRENNYKSRLDKIITSNKVETQCLDTKHIHTNMTTDHLAVRTTLMTSENCERTIYNRPIEMEYLNMEKLRKLKPVEKFQVLDNINKDISNKITIAKEQDIETTINLISETTYKAYENHLGTIKPTQSPKNKNKNYFSHTLDRNKKLKTKTLNLIRKVTKEYAECNTPKFVPSNTTIDKAKEILEEIDEEYEFLQFRLKDKLKELEKIISQNRKDVIQKYFDNLQKKVQECRYKDPRKWFQIVLPKTATIKLQELKINNQIEEDPQKLADKAAEYFEEIFKPTPEPPNERPWKLLNLFNDITNNNMENLTKWITLEEYNEILKKKPIRKSPETDSVTYEMIKNLPEHISREIVLMMNSNLTNHKIPADWKIGKIILLLKPHKTETEIKNYRPITLLKVIYKIFSSILADRLSIYMETNKIISPTQQGFIKGRDIKNHINTLIATLEHVKTQNKEIHILSTDIEKAFDNISFAGIEEAAKLLKIPEDFTNLILNSLEGTSFIDINGTKSKTFNTHRGTKQGDPLSPLIFNIFIEPLNR